ncbi:molybdopterin converting factor subunit 1 [Metabacillus malikii]|uniref:Molybdopterin synthase sulfur carrier subunit n=1 Tax=Metabacillus malikii TaxID=1504265 RepID=A0ABT9ZCL2_9BACI|nr:molybdopterin converting factor subunit 1 [Metabacillus malikii]MDQ0229551.1 molybdopterin synthase sulfur carrier subunit [Metabacillus malikii]
MITVLLFAHLQEQAGKSSTKLDDKNLTVLQVKEKIAKEYKLGDLSHVMVAINEDYALNEDIVREGDVVAFIPPVSGG